MPWGVHVARSPSLPASPPLRLWARCCRRHLPLVHVLSPVLPPAQLLLYPEPAPLWEACAEPPEGSGWAPWVVPHGSDVGLESHSTGATGQNMVAGQTGDCPSELWLREKGKQAGVLGVCKGEQAVLTVAGAGGTAEPAGGIPLISPSTAPPPGPRTAALRDLGTYGGGRQAAGTRASAQGSEPPADL